MSVIRICGLVATTLEMILWIAILWRECFVSYPNRPVIVILIGSLVLIVNLFLLTSLLVRKQMNIRYQIASWIVWSAIMLSAYATFIFLLAIDTKQGQDSINRFFGAEVDIAYMFVGAGINILIHSIVAVYILKYGQSMIERKWIFDDSYHGFNVYT